MSGWLGRERGSVSVVALNYSVTDFMAEWWAIRQATHKFYLNKSFAANTEFNGFDVLKKNLLLTLILDAPNLNASAISTPFPSPGAHNP